jgi:dTDP-3-amino-3,4,6-trideoxy-alpha-D-glucose transaminase
MTVQEVYIPYVDMVAQTGPLAAELSEAFARVVASGRFVQGPEVEMFEGEFAGYLGCASVVAVSNGTAALLVTLQALGVGPGDEVITIPTTFVATAEAIAMAGAKPVFVDVDDEGMMDPTSAHEHITERTGAVVPVHLHGRPHDLSALRAALGGWDGPIVADGAQAHGAKFRGQSITALADATTFSFYPSKNLGAVGEGGAVATSRRGLAERIRSLRSHRSDVAAPGFNWRLGELEAASLRVALPRLDQWNEMRVESAAIYSAELADVIRTPSPLSGHVYHHYVVRHADREGLRKALSDAGVDTLVHYPVPVHHQRPFDAVSGTLRLPVAEGRCSEILSLPLGPWLSGEMTREVARRVRLAHEGLERR